ncbi:MAG: DUF1697 domain-containing protein [Proteobacteria bacterium]|nr:DUF1697 domain-containing protein [Pseudomonadota bacterium]
MTEHVALLRGINVGGHRKLPMADLREVCGQLGWEDVRTYIQSGNVWFAATQPDAGALSDAIKERWGFDVPVVLRPLASLEGVLASSPFRAAAEEDPKRVHVAFMSEAPDAAAVAALDPNRSPGDQLVCIGTELHLFFGGPSHKSKLTVDWLEKRLGVRITARNWRSVSRLASGR